MTATTDDLGAPLAHSDTGDHASSRTSVGAVLSSMTMPRRPREFDRWRVLAHDGEPAIGTRAREGLCPPHAARGLSFPTSIHEAALSPGPPRCSVLAVSSDELAGNKATTAPSADVGWSRGGVREKLDLRLWLHGSWQRRHLAAGGPRVEEDGHGGGGNASPHGEALHEWLAASLEPSTPPAGDPKRGNRASEVDSVP